MPPCTDMTVSPASEISPVSAISATSNALPRCRTDVERPEACIGLIRRRVPSPELLVTVDRIVASSWRESKMRTGVAAGERAPCGWERARAGAQAATCRCAWRSRPLNPAAVRPSASSTTSSPAPSVLRPGQRGQRVAQRHRRAGGSPRGRHRDRRGGVAHDHVHRVVDREVAAGGVVDRRRCDLLHAVGEGRVVVERVGRGRRATGTCAGRRRRSRTGPAGRGSRPAARARPRPAVAGRSPMARRADLAVELGHARPGWRRRGPGRRPRRRRRSGRSRTRRVRCR